MAMLLSDANACYEPTHGRQYWATCSAAIWERVECYEDIMRNTAMLLRTGILTPRQRGKIYLGGLDGVAIAKEMEMLERTGASRPPGPQMPESLEAQEYRERVDWKTGETVDTRWEAEEDDVEDPNTYESEEAREYRERVEW